MKSEAAHKICCVCVNNIKTLQNYKPNNINSVYPKWACLDSNCVVVGNTKLPNSERIERSLYKVTLSGRLISNLIKASILESKPFDIECKSLVLSNISDFCKEVNEINGSKGEFYIYSDIKNILKTIESLINKCEYFNLLG